METMRLVKFAIQTQFHSYFLASQSRGNRMQAYGIWNRPQHTSMMIRMASSVFESLNDVFLNMTGQLTRNQRESLVVGTLQLKTRKFHGFTTFKCVNQLDVLADKIRDMRLQRVIEFAQATSDPHR